MEAGLLNQSWVYLPARSWSPAVCSFVGMDLWTEWSSPERDAYFSSAWLEFLWCICDLPSLFFISWFSHHKFVVMTYSRFGVWSLIHLPLFRYCVWIMCSLLSQTHLVRDALPRCMPIEVKGKYRPNGSYARLHIQEIARRKLFASPSKTKGAASPDSMAKAATQAGEIASTGYVVDPASIANVMVKVLLMTWATGTLTICDRHGQ